MLLIKTHQYQSSLAQYCRTGKLTDIPGINLKNIPHYRRLVFNNVIDSLKTAYPLTLNLLSQEEWFTLVNRFFSNHNIQSPQIWHMPKELIEYVAENELELITSYPCLLDLLNFEWLEIAMFMMPNLQVPQTSITGLYTLNPEMEMIRVSYPVHLKNAKNINIEDLGNYFIAIHRNPTSGYVQFTNLTIPYVDLLEQMDNNPLTITEIHEILIKYASLDDVKIATEVFINQALETSLIFTS